MKTPRMTHDEFADYVDGEAARLDAYGLVEVLELTPAEVLEMGADCPFRVIGASGLVNESDEFLKWVSEQLWAQYRAKIVERMANKLEGGVIIVGG